MLPGVILLGCTLFGTTAVVNTRGGWFYSQVSPSSSTVYFGTLSYAFSSHPSQNINLRGSIRNAGVAAMCLAAFGFVFCFISTAFALILSFGWLGKRSFFNCTGAWLTALFAGIFYACSWAEYLGVMYSDWSTVLPVLNAPQAGWALIMVAAASSLSFMCSALLLWAFVGRNIEGSEHSSEHGLVSSTATDGIVTEIDPDDLDDS